MIPIRMSGCLSIYMGLYFAGLLSGANITRGRIYLAYLIYAGYAVYLFFAEDGVLDWINHHNAENIAETMKATKPWIEETREFFGLVILIVVLAIDYIYAKRKIKHRAV